MSHNKILRVVPNKKQDDWQVLSGKTCHDTHFQLGFTNITMVGILLLIIVLVIWPKLVTSVYVTLEATRSLFFRLHCIMQIHDRITRCELILANWYVFLINVRRPNPRKLNTWTVRKSIRLSKNVFQYSKFFENWFFEWSNSINTNQKDGKMAKNAQWAQDPKLIGAGKQHQKIS